MVATLKKNSHFDEILQNKMLLAATFFFYCFIKYMVSIIGFYFFEINA
jgi:hypothetical protein